MGNLGDGLSTPFTVVYNIGVPSVGRVAAEVGFYAVDRQVQGGGDFLIPQPFLPEFMDSELFSFCHNKSLSERYKVLLTLRPRKRINMRMTKK